MKYLFVNDGSSDNTLTLIKQEAQKHEFINYLSFSRNFGHQAALKAGIDFAKGNAVISLDADLQHPVQIIPEMIAYWKKGFDVVYTQRIEEKNTSVFKKWTSKYFYFLIRRLSDVNIEEGTADFRLLDRKVVDLVRQSNDSFLFIRGLIPWMGFKQQKIMYTADVRFSGQTKYSVRKMANFAINGITGFSIKPLRMATFLGLVISLFSFIYALYAVIVYFMDDQVISGWASVLTSVLFIGGIQLIILGIIGEYIGKMYIQSKNRPFYIVEEHRMD
jgi:glycosyltransferase involved in cell wall biosynthesis